MLTILRAAKWLGLFWISRRLTANWVRVLAYHGGWIPDDHRYAGNLFMRPSTFERRMRHLARAGFNVISLDAAMKAFSTGAVPRSSVVITIDDGWHSTYDGMVPVLERYGFPATIYVTTYYAEKQQPVLNVFVHYLMTRSSMSRFRPADVVPDWRGELEFRLPAEVDIAASAFVDWIDEHYALPERMARVRALAQLLHVDMEPAIAGRWFHLMNDGEIREALERGIDIQLHTHRHRLKDLDEKAIEREIVDNRRVLGAATSLPDTHFIHFCYPNGEYRDGLESIFRRLGVVSGVTAVHGLNDASIPPLTIRRIFDEERKSQLQFEAEMAGIFLIPRRLLRALRARRSQGHDGVRDVGRGHVSGEDTHYGVTR